MLALRPGVGPVHVATLLATMPELGRLNRRPAAQLLGTLRSGHWRPRPGAQPGPGTHPHKPANIPRFPDLFLDTQHANCRLLTLDEVCG